MHLRTDYELCLCNSDPISVMSTCLSAYICEHLYPVACMSECVRECVRAQTHSAG